MYLGVPAEQDLLIPSKASKTHVLYATTIASLEELHLGH